MNYNIHIIAQVTSEYSVFAQWGALGVILWWALVRIEKILSNMTTQMSDGLKSLGGKVDTLAKAMLMDVINRDSTGVHTKQVAREALAKIEADENK